MQMYNIEHLTTLPYISCTNVYATNNYQWHIIMIVSDGCISVTIFLGRHNISWCIIIGVKLTTDFVVDSDLEGGHTWTARVHAGPAGSGTVSLIFYFYNEGQEAINFTVHPNSKELETVSGNVAKAR